MTILADPRVPLLHELAAALQHVGTPPGRVEHTLEEVAGGLGLRGSFFALPAAVLVSVETDEGERTRVVAAPTGEVDLAALEAVRAVCRDVAQGGLTPEEARDALAGILASPAPFGPALTVVSFAWVSGLAAVLFGGGVAEALAAGLGGGLIGAWVLGASRWGIAGLVEAISAALAALVASLVASRVAYAPDIAVLSALIVLVPGFTIHRALTDLSTGHLLSGSSRMAQAAAVLLLMGFGVALGGRAATALVGAPQLLEVVGLPGWVRTAALLAMTPALVVLFQAPARSSLWIAAAVSIAWFGSLVGADLLGSDLGPFVGAFALGVFSLTWERLLDRPAALPLAPGLLVLVPGAIGFRGVAALLGGDPMRAVETGFSALLVATSLVTGLLVANVLVRGAPRPGVAPADPA